MAPNYHPLHGRHRSTRARARLVLRRLKKRYPEIGTALDYRSPWELLVSTIISAQTTDENVNSVTPRPVQAVADGGRPGRSQRRGG